MAAPARDGHSSGRGFLRAGTYPPGLALTRGPPPASGLPLHIAAALLGHIDLDTTRGYTAVFPADVIRHHQEFIARRRALRQSDE